MELGPVFAYLFQQSIDTGEIPMLIFAPCLRRARSLLSEITALFLWHAFLVSFLNISFARILWPILMNMNSCRTGNTHLGNDIAVKLS